jgi:dienelactone hydrolase
MCAPKLAAIVPGDVPLWRRRWESFLFSNNEIPKPEEDSKQLDVKRSGPNKKGNKIERFHLDYKIDEGARAEAHLLLPENRKGKLPGVVVFHETYPIGNPWEAAGSLDPKCAIRSGLPKEDVVKDPRYIAAHLARKYAVFVPRCFIFTKKTRHKKKPWDFDGALKKMKINHPNWKWGISQMILEGMRAVDVLRKQPEVDCNNIGAIGHSLGGKQVLFVMAFDQRINVGVSSDGGIGLCSSDWDKAWYLGPEIRYREFDTNQILAMIAPHAFLLVGGKHDNDRAWSFIAGAMPLWKAAGCLAKVGWYRHDKGHCWPPEAQKAAYPFLGRYLKQRRMKVESSDGASLICSLIDCSVYPDTSALTHGKKSNATTCSTI